MAIFVNRRGPTAADGDFGRIRTSSGAERSLVVILRVARYMEHGLLPYGLNAAAAPLLPAFRPSQEREWPFVRPGELGQVGAAPAEEDGALAEANARTGTERVPGRSSGSRASLDRVSADGSLDAFDPAPASISTRQHGSAHRPEGLRGAHSQVSQKNCSATTAAHAAPPLSPISPHLAAHGP